ncbi:MAG: HEAT repeat domain-containing protein [Candidatus Micrarchaeia archaeon]
MEPETKKQNMEDSGPIGVPEHYTFKNSILKLVQKIKGPDLYEKQLSATKLCKSKDPKVVRYVLDQLEDKNPIIRENIISNLYRFDIDTALIGLKRGIEDIDAKVREAAADCLGELKERKDRVLKLLNKGLNDNVPEVREAAVMSIAKIGGKRAMRMLKEAFFNENDSSIRATIIYELAERFGKDAKKILLEALFDPNEKVAENASNELEDMLNKEDLLYLVRKYKEGTPEMKKRVRDLIWGIGDLNAMEFINFIDEPTKYADKFILSQLGDKNLKELPKLMVSERNEQEKK